MKHRKVKARKGVHPQYYQRLCPNCEGSLVLYKKQELEICQQCGYTHLIKDAIPEVKFKKASSLR